MIFTQHYLILHLKYHLIYLIYQILYYYSKYFIKFNPIQNQLILLIYFHFNLFILIVNIIYEENLHIPN